MLSLATLPPAFVWAAAIIVGFPLVSVGLGEVILRLKRRGHALAVPFAALRATVLPSLVVLLLMRQVIGWDRETISFRGVETLLWLFIVHTSLSFLNAVLFAGAAEGTWQSRFPRLFIDLIRVVVVLAAGAVVFSTVWDKDLGQLVEALGVGTLCIGLALQQPLGNLFSGIFLMIERPVAVGDWIKFERSLGKVVQTNWRAVHLQTRDGNLIVIPNGSLSKGVFTNFSRPSRPLRKTVQFGFAYEDPPNKVKAILRDAAVRTPGVLADPPPEVRFLEFEDSYNLYEVKLAVADFERAGQVVEEYRTLVWYATERYGLNMPYPTQVHKVEAEPPAAAPLPPQAIEAFPRFNLGQAGGAGSTVKLFGRGERVVAEGKPLQGIHLILDGTATLTARTPGGIEAVVTQLTQGEFFGERSLISGQVSDVTVTAADDLEVLVLEADTLHELLARTPQLGREIGQVIESRRLALAAVRSAAAQIPA